MEHRSAVEDLIIFIFLLWPQNGEAALSSATRHTICGDRTLDKRFSLVVYRVKRETNTCVGIYEEIYNYITNNYIKIKIPHSLGRYQITVLLSLYLDLKLTQFVIR